MVCRHITTGRLIEVGSSVASNVPTPGGLAIVTALHPPHKPDSSGRLAVKWLPEKPGDEGIYYATVFNCHFVEE